MADLYIGWSEYHQKIERLAAQIYHSGWEFNQIVCIAKGGLRVGDLMARIYDRPLAIVSASSYGGPSGQERGALKIAPTLTATRDRLGTQVLLVDDLVDSGISLREMQKWLWDRYGDEIEEIRTAVIWYKANSIVKPDYYVDYLPDNPWIHQPFEPYERMTPAELAAQYEPTSPH
ncbi:phosphoribosyltransferase [Phormidium sp. CCY1219]|uniref:phosphoribosyltransferase n=1 Tax=Phormidium sp. CCY1219 TaxID=2886104 RepID=UPI002D1E9A88|nr:phosphoribosyltransferase domain-containing protein [Phormidium sp. CCY1219]MEB3829064.1 phosphoribosyltransferase domain-containing protein [Phormidium sp. CCY1219]